MGQLLDEPADPGGLGLVEPMRKFLPALGLQLIQEPLALAVLGLAAGELLGKGRTVATDTPG